MDNGFLDSPLLLLLCSLVQSSSAAGVSSVRQSTLSTPLSACCGEQRVRVNAMYFRLNCYPSPQLTSPASAAAAPMVRSHVLWVAASSCPL